MSTPARPESNCPRRLTRWPRATTGSRGLAYLKSNATRESAIEDPDGHNPRLFFQHVPEGKVARNRVHRDVRAAPGLQGEERMAALEVECARLVALGATRVRRDEPAPPLSAGFIVMTDPEGNEFCLD